MPKNNPFVSVIVPFVEYDDNMKECINGVLNLKYPTYELIIVSDEKKEIPKNQKIKCIVSGKKTISYKRNLAMKKSDPKVEYFAFIDSDACPKKDWLRNTINLFKKNKKISAAGGPNIKPENADYRETCASNSVLSPFVSGMKYFQCKISESRFVDDLPTCNLIIRKDVIKSVGMFDEKLMTGEDLDLCLKIKRKGGKILFSKDIVVYHHRRKIFKPFLRQRFVYGMSVYKLFKKNPSVKSLYLLIPPLIIVYIVLGIAFSFFSVFVFIFFMETLFFAFLLSLFEGMRTSENIKQVFGTASNIFLSFFVSGIGAFLGVIKNSDSKNIYEKR